MNKLAFLIITPLLLITCSPEKTAKKIKKIPAEFYVIGISSFKASSGKYYYTYYLNQVPDSKDTVLILEDQVAQDSAIYKFGSKLILEKSL